MKYEFRCPTCDGVTEVTRTVEHRNEPLFCDGGGTFDDPFDEYADATHNTVEMERVVSRLAAVRVIGRRYA
jgi:hypothetical protein